MSQIIRDTMNLTLDFGFLGKREVTVEYKMREWGSFARQGEQYSHNVWIWCVQLDGEDIDWMFENDTVDFILDEIRNSLLSNPDSEFRRVFNSDPL